MDSIPSNFNCYYFCLQENLFYKVLPGAMQSYRESIEARCAQIKVKSYFFFTDVEY